VLERLLVENLFANGGLHSDNQDEWARQSG
jgi:hypothetical protein